jgi:hypothetical protein
LTVYVKAGHGVAGLPGRLGAKTYVKAGAGIAGKPGRLAKHGFGWGPFGAEPFGGLASVGAVGNYIPTTGDVGYYIRCIVTATNAEGSFNATALPTTAVAPLVVPPPAPPATDSYIPTVADVGYFVRCVITAVNPEGSVEAAALPTTAVAASAPPPAPSTIDVYLPTVLDIGYSIRCVITADNAEGAGLAASLPTTPVVGQPSPPPLPPPVPNPTPTQIVGHYVQPLSYRVQIGWEVASGNLAIVGLAIVGTSVLGETAFDQKYGPGDDVSDVVLSPVSISRGRDDPTSVFLASTASFQLLDPDGRYNPKNANSDLAGLIRPFRQVRITALFGGLEYIRFAGFVREIQWEPHQRGGIASIDCVDLLAWLQRYSPTIPTTGATTTGTAIGMILDAIGWTVASLRSLSDGDAIPSFGADGSKTALQLIEDLLEAERGIFYISPEGVATYKDRQAKNEQTTPRFTIADSMVAMAPGVSVDTVKNVASVTAVGGVPQVSQDASSILLYGLSEWPAIASAYIANDSQAASLGDYLVALGKNPKSPVWGFTIRNETFDNLAALLAMDLDDLLAISEPQGSTAGNFYIEGYSEEINKDQNLHQLELSLSERAVPGGGPGGGGGVALVGTATVDGPDVVGF